MERICLVLEYDGAEFSGWQLQPEERTVQGTVEAAVAALLKREDRVRVDAAGRTDAGVHARGQVVAFDSDRTLPDEAWTLGLNALLPEDVAVVGKREVPPDFDPRRHASGKRYEYTVWNGPTRRPTRRRTAWMWHRSLDLEAMQSAAASLLGRHDFESFRGQGCTARTTVRELRRLEVVGEVGGAVGFIVEADAFLKHMVRNLVGTVVEVGSGLRAAGAIPGVLAARDRRAAGRTAPAHGLCLEEVYYGRRER